MTPLVSILIPAYNAAEWIADTLRSAVAQTWPRKEIIVVDDGSSDDTVAIAREFASKSVCVVTQENQGGPAARNTALERSQGDYIQWLDHDDLLAPDKVARQMTALGQGFSKWTLLSSEWGEFMYRPSRAEFIPTVLWQDLSPAEFLLRKIGQNLYMQTGVWLVSRELTESAGPWDIAMLTDDDGEYFCRVLRHADSIRFVSNARVFYRKTGSARGSNMGRSARKLEAKFRAMQIHIATLRSMEESERVREASIAYLQQWLIHFYPDKRDIIVQAEQMARELGGHLEVPRLSWKYAWIRRFFGWSAARNAQLLLPSVRWAAHRSWDKLLHRFEGGDLIAHLVR